MSESESLPDAGSPTTHWSCVQRAGDPGDQQRQSSGGGRYGDSNAHSLKSRAIVSLLDD